MRTVLRYFLLALGLAIFGWFLHRAGSEEILSAFVKLGWFAPLILVPYCIVYVIDTIGWRFAFGKGWGQRIAFLTLFRVRWAGEAINNVIPSAYVGGEALKVYLLKKRGIPASDATASVVIGKTAQTLSQVIFIGLGSLAFTQLADSRSGLGLGMIVVLLLGIAVVGALFGWQRQGLFAVLFKLARGLKLRMSALEINREKLLRIDHQISGFYRQDKKSFLLSASAYLLGWMADTFEIFLVAYLMGVPIGWTQALAVEAFVGVAKVMGLFVPGALGIQESGIVFLCRSAGLPEGFGVAYAIIRRGREVVYALVGWLLVYIEEVSLKQLAGHIALGSRNDL
jgi:putative membrane protein